MERVKIAQIGAAHDHAAMVYDSLKRLKEFELLGYAVPEDESVQTPAVYKGSRCMTVEELLFIPGLQAVTVETTEPNLTKYAMLAAEKGLSIHMDKPGGISLAEFEALIDLVRQKSLVFHTGYMYRYNPAVMQLMEDIKAGKLGEIYCVEAHMDCMHKPEKRQWLGQFPGGMMFYLGCHLIDLIYRIMGAPDEVIPLNCSTGIDGVTAEDYGMAVLRYPKGISFAKTCAAEPGGYLRRQLVVCGSKGTVSLLPFEAADEGYDVHTVIRTVDKDIDNWRYDGEYTKTQPHNRYDGMMHAFAAYVKGEKPNPYSYADELELYCLLLQCCGKKIKE